jgi:hypothetical protein
VSLLIIRKPERLQPMVTVQKAAPDAKQEQNRRKCTTLQKVHEYVCLMIKSRNAKEGKIRCTSTAKLCAEKQICI